MTTGAIANLEKLLGTPRDGALLRFSIGSEYLKAGDAERAVAHLRVAVAGDPHYSAAWKLLGRALESAGLPADAREAYLRGIAVAQARGDRQAAKEMTVFARRLEQSHRQPAP